MRNFEKEEFFKGTAFQVAAGNFGYGNILGGLPGYFEKEELFYKATEAHCRIFRKCTVVPLPKSRIIEKQVTRGTVLC